MIFRHFDRAFDIRRSGTLRTRGLGLVLAVGGFASPLAAQDAAFREFPVVVFCEYEGIHHAYYFSQLGEDGRAIYLTPDRLAASITAQGVAESVDGERAGTCAGKTLSELRESGQAFDLP